MKLYTIVHGRKTKTEFVEGQNPVMPSPILPQNQKFIMAPMGKFKQKFKTIITPVVQKIES